MVFVRGPEVQNDDPPNFGFHSSSLARALLENFSATKATRQRVLRLEDIEKRLENLLHVKGEGELNRIRDRARILANEFGWQTEFKNLDRMLGAMLGTRSNRNLKTAVARARGIGMPYDPRCNENLEFLFAELRTNPLPEVREKFKSQDHFGNKAFFESYFSNYIEGTTFGIEEAEEIVFDKKIPDQRPKDAHDVLGKLSDSFRS